MDKYTYNLKTEKIQKLVREGDFATAAKIADTLEWKQEHNVRLLTTVAEAYEKTEQYASAIDILLIAYEQAPVSKRILYRLTEMAIAEGNISDAETFYKKYLEEAPDENDRYILRYLIAEAKGEDLEKRIVILETYKKYEFEEEWACRLAELYREADRKDDCVALCDEIILWFGVGTYVDRAMELKESYVPLTDSQRERRDNREYYQAQLDAVAREMEEKDKAEEPAPEEADDLPVIALSAEVAGAKLQEPPAPERLPRQEKKRHDVPQAVAEEQKADRIQAILSAATRQMKEGPGRTAAAVPEETEMPAETPAPEEPMISAESTVPEEMVMPGEEAVPGEPAAFAEPEEAPMRENLDETREFIPARVLEAERLQASETVMEPVPPEETPESEPEEVPEAAAGTEAEPAAGEKPAQESAAKEESAPEEEPEPEETPEEEPESMPAPVPAEEEPDSMPAPVPAEEEQAASTLESDPGVLPVLSFEETEQAVWEEQNRRREEQEPLESYELERCIFVSASTPEERIDRAVEALEAYHRERDEELPRIAKIVAERLNRRGIIHSLPQLNGKDLIIDEANGLSEEMIEEMLKVLDYLDVDKVFVLMDVPAEMSKLKQRVRSEIIDSENSQSAPGDEEEEEEEELPKIRLTNLAGEPSEQEVPEEEPPAPPRRVVKVEREPSFDRMNPKQELSEKEFVRYSEHYASELECVIDKSGYKALQEEIEAIREEGARLTVSEARAVIEEAAEHAEKFTIKRIFSSKYDKEGYLILRNRDFL